MQCLGHGMTDAHKLGEDDRGFISPLLTNDEFHRSGIHAVPQRSNERQISHAQQGVEIILFDRLMVMMHWDEIQ